MNGFIIINKTKDWTSFDVCAKLRSILGIKKIGHTGTLDPNATGVLPICIGKATKFCNEITDWSKEYICDLILGKQSDSFDITGNIVNSYEYKVIDQEIIFKTDINELELSTDKICETINSFIKTYNQYPPIYSARKVNGKRLYEYARTNKDVEIKPKEITINDIQILEINLPIIKLKVSCSKGTYIRSLCNDIGNELGCMALMGDLIRTKVGPFDINDSIEIFKLQDLDIESIRNRIINIKDVFEYPSFNVKQSYNKLLFNGNKISFNMIDDLDENYINSDKVYLYSSNNDLVGLYYKDGDYFRPDIILINN